ncbi:MAG: hypothetical protein ABSH51_19000 [Solirubrobacteraceae bacterium]
MTDSQAPPHTTVALSLGWVVVYVDDPRAASDFYAATFGLRPEFAAPDPGCQPRSVGNRPSVRGDRGGMDVCVGRQPFARGG